MDRLMLCRMFPLSSGKTELPPQSPGVAFPGLHGGITTHIPGRSFPLRPGDVPAGSGDKEPPSHGLAWEAAGHSRDEAIPGSSRCTRNKAQHAPVAGAGEEAWAIKERKWR